MKLSNKRQSKNVEDQSSTGFKNHIAMGKMGKVSRKGMDKVAEDLKKIPKKGKSPLPKRPEQVRQEKFMKTFKKPDHLSLKGKKK